MDVREHKEEVKSLAGCEGTKKLNNATSFYNRRGEQTKIKEKEVTGKDPLCCDEIDTRKKQLTSGNKHGLIKSIVKRTFDCDDENTNSAHKKSAATPTTFVRQLLNCLNLKKF